MRPATTPQSKDSVVALRAAVAAQSTGLNFATVPIQPGARLSCISAPERNVSGSSSSADGADQRLALARQDPEAVR